MYFHLRGLPGRWTLPFVGTIMLILNLLLTQSAHAAALSSVWSVVKSPNVASGQFANNSFSGVAAISDSDVWAVGFEGSTGVDPSGFHPLTEHWNGSAWSISLVGTQVGQLNGVSAASTSDVWAVGNVPTGDQDSDTSTLIEHWNGHAWSVVPSPNPTTVAEGHTATLQGVAALSATNAWAAGWFSDAVENLPLIEHWDGTSWSIVANVPTEIGTPSTFLNGITAISANDIWAVGEFGDAQSFDLAMHWDGTTWSLTDPPVNIDQGSNETLQGVSAVSHTDVWAVGDDMDSQNTQQPFAIHWNGSKWSQIATPPSKRNGGVSSQLTAVAALSSSDVWAVGIDGLGGFLEHWNGSSWSLAQTPTLGPAQGGGVGSSALFGITRSGTTSLWAVGSTTPTPLTTNTLTIHTLAG